jgi:hypothetical protein
MFMKRICCSCEKYLGSVPPYDDESVTHGYCKKCYEALRKELKKLEKRNKKRRVL